MWMCCDIFAATQLWRGSLLTTGHLSSSHPVVVGEGDVVWGLLLLGSLGVLRTWCCHLSAGFQQCQSLVKKMCTVRCCPLWHPSHCPMGTVPLVLVRRTASPTYAGFVGLSSGADPVVVRLDVVSFLPSSSSQTVAGCLLGGYPVGRDHWGGKCAAGGMSEDKE